MKLINRTTIALLLAGLLSLALTTAMVVPASAEHDGGDEGGVSDMLTPSDDGILASALGLLGSVDRARYAVFGPDDTADENLDAAIQEFNAGNETFVEYANNRDIHEGEVVQVDCVIDGETATGYIVAEYNDTEGNYTSAKAVESTDRTVDYTVVLEKNACDNAAEEIDYFHDEFASQDKDVTRRYMSTMASKYAGNVDEPFTGGS